MIVYRNHTEKIDTIEKLLTIEKITDRLIAFVPENYDDAIELLIETGELETGITDFYCFDKDLINNQIAICRKITMCAGNIVYFLWKHGILLKNEIYNAIEHVNNLKTEKIPQTINNSVPEGFVYYGLYPETYLEAAENFYKEIKPENVTVIGLRSIGTQLSAIVAALLENCNCNVNTFTVRPQGHPFDRFLKLDSSVIDKIRCDNRSYVILVDEGPGLSGSSIGGSLREMIKLGIQDEKLVIFPSWMSDENNFISENAKTMWKKCRKYVGSFENQWVKNHKLENILKKKIIFDISSGRWRGKKFKDESEYPAVNPQHERRKYLIEDDSYKGSSRWLAKFVGLGKYGRKSVLRADILSEFGFSPHIHKLKSGFAVMEYVDGKPLSSKDKNSSLFDFVIKYLSCINQNMTVSNQNVSYDHMMEMIYCNIEEGLGSDWCQFIEDKLKMTSHAYEESPVSIDGRMMPQDFLKTPDGILKVDHIEHNSDQFFYGCQNIAWDVVGFCVEFNLDHIQTDQFIKQFKTVDPHIHSKTPFFMVAYLAFRLGYVTLAAKSLEGKNDGIRFQSLKSHYSRLLKEQLLRT